MTDRDALLRQALDTPADDPARLVSADWCKPACGSGTWRATPWSRTTLPGSPRLEHSAATRTATAGGHAWSAWQPLGSAATLPTATAAGVYRLRDAAKLGLLYIGEGLVAARLIAHLRKARVTGDLQGKVLGSAGRLERSWLLSGEWLPHQRLELECDLIAGHLLGTGTVPPAQFIG